MNKFSINFDVCFGVGIKLEVFWLENKWVFWPQIILLRLVTEGLF